MQYHIMFKRLSDHVNAGRVLSDFVNECSTDQRDTCGSVYQYKEGG